MKKIMRLIAWFVLFLSAVNCIAAETARRLHWVKNGQQSALVFDDPQPMIDGLPSITRDGIQLGNDSPIKLNGYLIFDNFANVMCGSLTVNGQRTWYDTPAYHDSFRIIPTFQNNQSYGNTIFLTNGFVFFFMGQSYTAAQIASGAVLPILQPYHVVYHKGINTVSSFMRFNSGFTILPDASASMSTLITITGPLDLRETGTLILSGDLTLESHITVSSGGKIDGQGHKLMLGGNLTFPANKIFHIMSDTVIDGQGYTLSIGDYGQLFVDNAITLTLQNIVLKSGGKTSIFPPLRCAGQKSKVVLDNTTLLPGANIPFYQGQLFVYDDVHFTGTSAFVYTSPQSSFIMPSSSLTFDPSTTFSFAPATMSKDQIVMSDATSSLVFNGSTLKCTDTGLRLTKGSLTYQGNVMVDTKSSLYLSSLTTITSGIYCRYSSPFSGMRSCWSPDGRFFAMAGDGGGAGRVYKLYGANGLLGTTIGFLPVTTYPYIVIWSTDQRYITLGAYTGAVGSWSNYSFNGTTFASAGSVSSGNTPKAIDWSPDGKYFAKGTQGSGGCQVYTFNGISTFKQVGSTIAYAGDLWSVKWHQSGAYLAIAGSVGVFIYSFNGATFTQVSNKVWSVIIYDCAWSPDGRYLAVGGATPNLVDGNILAADNIRIYSFNNATGVLTAVIGRKYGTAVYGLGWHPDSKTLAVGGNGAANGGTNNPFTDTNLVRLYQFTGTVLNGLLSYTLSSPLSNITTMWSTVWDPSGNYLCIAGIDGSYIEYYGILKASFVTNPNPQALTNSLVYGNAALGSSANLTLNGLPTTVRGKIFSDNIGTEIINLKSDATIASNSILHITRDTIIDGSANILTAGDYGQLFVDNAVTVTLKNMIFSSGAKTSVFPPLRCAGSTSKVAFDNVTLLPGADIPFYQGQMFVYDDVHFTGTSAFVYTSPQSSFIMPSSSLTFDPLTTFSFAPATVSKDQIIMSNATSSLVLNGSTLKCTDTGLRLTKGALTYQGSVTVDTKNSFYFSALSTTTWVRYGGYVFSVSLRQDGRYLAIGGQSPGNGSGGFANTDELRVYTFNGAILVPSTSIKYGNSLYGVAWSPDGRFLAIVGSNPTNGAGGFANTDQLRVYSFNGITFTPVISAAYGLGLYSLSWSPDGNFLAIGGISPANGAGGFANTDELRIYRFTGVNLVPVTSKAYGVVGNDTIRAITWSPNGKYLAIGGQGAYSVGGFTNTDRLRVYQFDGANLSAITSQPCGTSVNTTVFSIAWSPDGRYLAFTGTYIYSGGGFANSDELRVYQFDGATLSAVTSQPYGTPGAYTGFGWSVTWSPDGKYLAIGGSSPAAVGGFANTDLLRIYKFNGSSLLATTSKTYGYGTVYSTAWSFEGKNLFLGGQGPLNTLSYSEVQIYAPVLGANPNPQALTNSLVYGNSALGSSGNLTVNGNYSTLRGNVLNQNV